MLRTVRVPLPALAARSVCLSPAVASAPADRSIQEPAA